MATVVAASRLAATAMAGRPASRLPHRSVAGVSRTGAILPGGPASGLRNLARRESPLIARIASDDDAGSPCGEEELEPLFSADEMGYLRFIVVFGPIMTIACLHLLEQNYENGRQYWPMFLATYAVTTFAALTPTLRDGFVEWQRRERRRSMKRKQQDNIAVVSRTGATLPVPASALHNLARRESPLVARIAGDDDTGSPCGEAELEPLVFADEMGYLGFIVVFAPIGTVACLHELEQNYENGRQHWPLFLVAAAVNFFAGVTPTLRFGFDRWQRREHNRSMKRKQQDRLAATAMAGRPASRLSNIAVVSRTGATLPVPASALHNLARRESPLVARIAGDDDTGSPCGEAELEPLVFADEMGYLGFIVVFAPIGTVACLHELEQNYENGRQHWPLFLVAAAVNFFAGVTPTLRFGFDRWQRREHNRSMKRKQQDGEAEPLLTTEEFWSIVYACVLTPIGLIGCLHELEQNYENGRQYWPLFYFVFFLYLCSGLATPLTYAFVRWQSRQRSQTRKQ
ncbi:hypothetical protein ACK3TF_003853 [Chlorella vulgaris]